jgi:DNA-binding NtrC family response regulator
MNQTVLVVDDQSSIRKLVAILLQELGFRVIQAENASVAIQYCRHATINLLVTDHVMPGITGLELAEIVTRDFGLPVVIMSGCCAAELSSSASSEYLFLKKPFTPDDLAKAVRLMLARATCQESVR